MRRLMILIALAAVLGGCLSFRADIPPDISPEELIQRGQEASDRSRNGLALQYYQAVPELFPSNIDMICAAEYEIAHIHYKQRKFELAKAELGELLARYDTPDEELLPPQFKILANIVLEQIAERESRGLFGRRANSAG